MITIEKVCNGYLVTIENHLEGDEVVDIRNVEKMVFSDPSWGDDEPESALCDLLTYLADYYKEPDSRYSTRRLFVGYRVGDKYEGEIPENTYPAFPEEAWEKGKLNEEETTEVTEA